MKNKILVNLWLDKGCSQEDGEYYLSWNPINFSIYSELFQDIVEESVSEYLSNIKLKEETRYELIMQHIVEHDGAGTVTSEYFEVLNMELSNV